MVIFHIVDFAALIQFTSMILFALLTTCARIISGSTTASRLAQIIFSGLVESFCCCLELLELWQCCDYALLSGNLFDRTILVLKFSLCAVLVLMHSLFGLWRYKYSSGKSRINKSYWYFLMLFMAGFCWCFCSSRERATAVHCRM